MSRIPRNLLVSTLTFSACLLFAVSTLAQDASSSAAASTPPKDEYRNITAQDIQLLRQNLRSERKQIIAANLPLSTTEAEKFWPVYDQYIAELVTMNGKKYELIQQYLQNGNSMSNARPPNCRQAVDRRGPLRLRPANQVHSPLQQSVITAQNCSVLPARPARATDD